MNTMYLRATAKINLALDVVRKREDGYHEVRMIMQMVGMYDRLYLTAHAARRDAGQAVSESGNTALPMRKDAADPGKSAADSGRKSTAISGQKNESDSEEHKPRITLTTNLPYIPTDEHNLVVKAAGLLMAEKGVTDDLEIRLDKFIPVAAGLAGGSSDAAMTLVGVNRLFHLGCTEEELCAVGKRIGADVPYCIMRGTALSEGIGEILTPLPPMPDCRILLSKPSEGVSTKEVYGNLRLNELTEEMHPDVDAMIRALRAGDLAEICARDNGNGRAVMGNVLETVTKPAHPVIGELENVMLEGGALNAIMSGSGPTVFGIFHDVRKAEETRDRLRAEYPSARTFLTWPENRLS